MKYTYPLLNTSVAGITLSTEQRIRRHHWLLLFMLNDKPESDQAMADHVVTELTEDKHLHFDARG